MFRKPYSRSTSLGDLIEDPNTFVQRATDRGVDIAQQRPGGATAFDVTSVMVPNSTIGKVASKIQTVQQIMHSGISPVSFIPGGALLNVAKLIPGVSKLLSPLTSVIDQMTGPLKGMIGKLTNMVFGGFFEKATHMGDCMKWWNNTNNIRGMVVGVIPIPISFTLNMEDYISPYYTQMNRAMREKFEQQRAAGYLTSLSLSYTSKISNLLTDSTRKNKIIDYYVQQVRANPDVMQAQCASMSKGQAETGANIDPAYVASIFQQFKDQAVQQETQETYNALESLIIAMKTDLENKLNPLNILNISSEQWKNTQKTRLVVAPALPGGTIIPIYKNGALVIVPGQQNNFVKNLSVGSSIVRRK